MIDGGVIRGACGYVGGGCNGDVLAIHIGVFRLGVGEGTLERGARFLGREISGAFRDAAGVPRHVRHTAPQGDFGLVMLPVSRRL